MKQFFIVGICTAWKYWLWIRYTRRQYFCRYDLLPHGDEGASFKFIYVISRHNKYLFSDYS